MEEPEAPDSQTLCFQQEPVDKRFILLGGDKNQ